MTFQVVWSPRAEQQLATIWMNASARERVSHAAETIDTKLRRDPTSVGESREENFRIAFQPPLVVRFQVREGDRLVVVFDVMKPIGD